MYFSIHLFFLQNILSICAVSVCDRTFKRPRLDESNLYDSSSCASDESCHTWQGYETGNYPSYSSLVDINSVFSFYHQLGFKTLEIIGLHHQPVSQSLMVTLLMWFMKLNTR